MKYKLIVLVMFLLALAGLALYPALRGTVCSAWSRSAALFLYEVGDALQKYALDHNGHLPDSLPVLYPKYLDDPRCRDALAKFGGRRMVITYFRPDKLGDPNVAVAEIRMPPDVSSGVSWRGWILRGDLRVHTE